MPSQTFVITRAPESEPITERRLRTMLWNDRKDSEWDVTEVKEVVPVQKIKEKNVQIYDLILVLRKVAKERTGDDRLLMIASANWLERLARQNVDIQNELRRLKPNSIERESGMA